MTVQTVAVTLSFWSCMLAMQFTLKCGLMEECLTIRMHTRPSVASLSFLCKYDPKNDLIFWMVAQAFFFFFLFNDLKEQAAYKQS